MKNRIKKKGLLVSMVSLLAIGAFAMGPVGAAGKPTIDLTKKGSITIHKFDGTEGLEGDGTLLADTANLGSPLKGIEFTVTRVQNSDKDPKTATPLVGTDAYKESDITDANGEIPFNVLAQGTYLVQETLNPSVSGKIDDFLISVPMMNPNGTEWMYDIHVYPKNEVRSDQPKVDKDFGDGSDNLTEQINKKFIYEIKADVPMDIENASKYEITDILDTRLTFHNEAFEVTLDGVALVEGTDYTVTRPTAAAGGTVKVVFTKAGFANLATVLPKDQNGTITGLAAGKLSIKYTASINETAITAPEFSAEIPNDVTLDYTNSLGKDYETSVPSIDQPIVKTGSILLEKVDADSNTVKLKDAEFKVFTSQADADAYIADAENKVDSSALNKVGENKDWIITTTATGSASFEGLAYGDYWIVETKAPTYDDGGVQKAYNLLKAPLAISVDKDSSKIVTLVENSKRGDGFDLPLTGGAGTAIFIISGISLIGGAFYLLFSSKKKSVL